MSRFLHSLRKWWANLGYMLGYFVGTCLPTSIIIWTLNSRVPTALPSAPSVAEIDSPSVEQAIHELSDEFIVVKSPNVRLTDIN